MVMMKLLLMLRNSLRMMNANFLDRNFNWYLRVTKFKF